ncbi:MAG TPA: TIGR02466 family protein [Bdellovibrionota bacterium]|nr:TIGR02466 family protein [Bdellovibrionota bacterium]
MAAMLLFPTLVHVAPLPDRGLAELNRELLKEAYAFRELDDSGRKWSERSYFGGYTSYGSLSDLPDRSPTFARLRKGIDRLAAKYARQLELDLGKRKLVMTSCWLNIMGKGCHHGSHLHPLSTLSGTYYVRVPRGSGAIKFEDPRLPMMMASPPRKPKATLANKRFVEVSPKPGTVVLFESWLKHEVPPNLSEQERVSVSFNYDWVG